MTWQDLVLLLEALAVFGILGVEIYWIKWEKSKRGSVS